MPVINTIKNLLLLAASTYINPLDIKILVANIVEDLLSLAVSTCKNPLVLVQITLTQREGDQNLKIIKYTAAKLYALLV